MAAAALPDTVSGTKHRAQSADAPQSAEEKEAPADPDAQHMARGASLLSTPEAENTDGTTDEPGQQGRSEHDLSVATGYTGVVSSLQHFLWTITAGIHCCSSSTMSPAHNGGIEREKPAWHLVP